jgi:hypothetical protein
VLKESGESKLIGIGLSSRGIGIENTRSWGFIFDVHVRVLSSDKLNVVEIRETKSDNLQVAMGLIGKGYGVRGLGVRHFCEL